MNWVAFAATIAAGFLMSPFLVNRLGDAVYGVWVLVGSLVGYLGLLDFGITQSTVKYVAEYRARDDKEAINRVVTGGLAVFSALGLMALGASAAVAIFFNDMFNTPLADNIAASVVLLVGLNLALTFPASVFVGVLRGYQRYEIDSAVTTISIVARSLILVALILRGYGIMALALTTFLFDMARLAYLIRWAYRLNPDIRIARAHLDRRELKRLFGYSVYAFLMSVGKKMIFYTDAIVIGLFLPVSAITLYSIASRLVTYLLQVSETMGVLTPTASDMDARKDRAGIREMLVLSTKYMLLIALPVAGVFFAMGDIFIGLWMGPVYAAGAPLLAVLTVAVLAHLIEMPAHTVLLGMGKHAVVAWFTLAQAPANLILSLMLVGPYGLMGVAMGTMIPMVAFTAVAIVVYFRRYLKLSLSDYLKRSAPLPLLMQLPFIASLLLLRTYSPPSSLAVFFLQIAAALVPYAALSFMFCMTAPERRPLLRLAEKLGLKLAPRFS